MAASLHTAPPSPAYNGNDIWIKVESDLVDTTATASFEIEFTTSGPSLTQTLELKWGGTTLVLTVEATTNTQATAIPTKDGGESLLDYHFRVAEALRENGLLSADFIITAHSDERIILTARTIGVLDLDHASTLSNATITVEDGTDPNTETNLAALVEIWQSGPEFNDESRIHTLVATYDAATGQTEFNLKGLFPTAPALPAENSIGPVVSLTWRHGDADTAAILYYLRLADRYGIPAVAEALVRTESTYTALHGARPEDHDNYSPIGFVRPLHGYRQAGGVFRKPVTDVQPDWFYILANAELTDCRVEFDVTWDNGAETTETPSVDIGTLEANKAHWIRSTPFDAGAYTPPAAGALPWYYTFKLIGNAGSGEVTLAEVYYIIRPCTPFDIYLLMDNGLGGCESVLCHGKTAFGFEASRESARMARSSSFNLRDAELINFNAEGQKAFSLNTGWHDLYYIEHLRQLLLGDVWLIDTNLKRFLRLLVDTDSITTHEHDGDLYSLSINVKTGWLDSGQNP